MSVGIYLLWGSLTVVGLVLSLLKVIDNRRKACENADENLKISSLSGYTITILGISSISAILFVIAGILFLYFLLMFTEEEPLLSNLLSIISLWPMVSACLLVFSIHEKIKAFVQPKLKTKSTIMIAVTIISIVLYYCFYGVVLYHCI